MSLSEEERLALEVESAEEARRGVQFAGWMFILLGVIIMFGLIWAKSQKWI